MQKVFLFAMLLASPVAHIFANGETKTTAASFTCTFNGQSVDTLVVREITNPAAFAADIIPPKKTLLVGDQQGHFSFQINDMNTRGMSRVLMELKINGKETNLMSNYYLTETGDSIHVEINSLSNGKLQTNYYGKGAAKYNCQRQVDSVFSNTYIWEVWNSTNKKLWTIANFRKARQDASKFPAFAILDAYKQNISDRAYQSIYADLMGRLLTNLDLVTTRLFFNTSIDKNLLRKEFAQLLPNVVRIPDVNDQLFSINYFNYLMARNGVEVIYWAKKEDEVTLLDVYRHVKKKNKGILREYIMATVLNINRYPKSLDIETTDSLWKDCFLNTREDILEEFLLNRITRKAKGREGLNFSLPDNHGKFVSLADFKGKVVLVDFWFSGCGGCLSYSKLLEQFVYPEFKNDSSVVFVSICADEDSAVWLKSLQSNRYSRPENINLFTSGKGFEHPLLQYYSINGGPFSLLFDRQGRIFSGRPPTIDMPTLLTMIKAAKDQR